MQVLAKNAPLREVAADCLVVGLWEDEPVGGALAQFDNQTGGALARLRQAGDLTGKANELTFLYALTGLAAERLLAVGLGKRATADRARVTAAAATAARALTAKPRNVIALALPEGVPGLCNAEVALAGGVGLLQGSYGPGLRKSTPARHLAQTYLLVAPPAAPGGELQQAAARAACEGQAVMLARELVNTPPCDLYPESLADRARAEALSAGLECEVFDEFRLEAERMGALLAVARGSERGPRLVVLRHRGGGNGPTLGLVGKGVTFDSGGLSLKTNEQMLDMKCDMAGAATVLAALTAAARLRLPVNLLGVMACVENLPSGRAMKLGDVLTARNGKTIEVLNTDAEGRLILADALAYAVDQKVEHLVDLATLTGACMVALGTEVAGLMGNNEAWADKVRAAAQKAGELVWPLPMWPHYGDLIKSHVADMKNTGGTRYGGAITGAKLLEQFVGNVPWVHLDIAGPAWADNESAARDPGGTGCLVRTLVALAERYGK